MDQSLMFLLIHQQQQNVAMVMTVYFAAAENHWDAKFMSNVPETVDRLGTRGEDSLRRLLWPLQAVDMDIPRQTFSDHLRPSQTFSDHLIPSPTISDLLRLSQTVSTFSDHLGLSQTSGHLRPSQTVSDLLRPSRPSQTISDLRPSQIISDLRPSQTMLDLRPSQIISDLRPSQTI